MTGDDVCNKKWKLRKFGQQIFISVMQASISKLFILSTPHVLDAQASTTDVCERFFLNI